MSSTCNETEWDISINGIPTEPRKYSNGKTQLDVVCEIIDSWSNGKTWVVLESAPGSGKTLVMISSVINHRALHGSDSDVGLAIVPTIPLAHQWAYYDYDEGIHRVSKARIKVILGKGNFTCPIKNVKADDKSLPCNQSGGYAEKLKKCPLYARPMPRSLFEKLSLSFDVEEVGSYVNSKGYEIVVYKRSKGVCPYYKQYIDALKADIVVVTDAKFRVDHETGLLLNATYKVFDEADEYLFRKIPRFVFSIDEVRSLRNIVKEYDARDEEEEELKMKLIREFNMLIAEFRRARSDEELHDYIFELKSVVNNVCSLEGVCDEDEEIASFINKLNEVSTTLSKYSSGVVFMKAGMNKIIITAIDMKAFINAHLKSYVSRGNHVLFASGTFPDRERMNNLFLEADAWIIGETRLPGVAYVPPRGLFSSFSIDVSGRKMRNDSQYLSDVINAFRRVLLFTRSIVKPRLIYVHSKYFIKAFMSKNMNMNIVLDEHGTEDYLTKLRNGELEEVASTRAGRGIDLPNVHGIIFTKAPYPDLSDPFWAILFRERPRLAEVLYNLITKWNTYQILARALRNENSWAVIISPDNRVLEIIQEYAIGNKLTLKEFTEFLSNEKPKAFIRANNKLVLKELAKQHGIQGEEIELTPELLKEIMNEGSSGKKE